MLEGGELLHRNKSKQKKEMEEPEQRLGERAQDDGRAKGAVSTPALMALSPADTLRLRI